MMLKLNREYRRVQTMADDRLRKVPPRKPRAERPASPHSPRPKGEEWLYFPKRATTANPSPKSQPTPAHERDMNLRVLHQVPVQVSAVLGKTTMQVSELLKLGRGAVVELDRRVLGPQWTGE